MDAPREFHVLISSLYWGSVTSTTTLESWAAGAAGRNGSETRYPAEAYLEELLARNPSAVELQKVWNSSSPSYFLTNDDQLREFLVLLLAALKARRDKEGGSDGVLAGEPEMPN